MLVATNFLFKEANATLICHFTSAIGDGVVHSVLGLGNDSVYDGVLLHRFHRH